VVKTLLQGQGITVNYGNNFRSGFKGLKFMIEDMGGFQVRYHQLEFIAPQE
jgi:hypothetical protein